MNLKFLLIILITLATVFYSCDDTVTNSDIDSKIIPDKNVSFGEYIQPVIYIKCSAIGYCHGVDETGAQGGVILTNWDTITEYVVPGDIETSRLAQIVDGTVKTHPAVPDNLKLTDNQIKGILTWIKEGAQNN